MLWLPTLKVDVAQVALPAARATAEQIVVAPSLNSTLPLGEPAPGAVTFTVAVNVTLWPNTDGLADELRLVDVLALFTTCDTAELVLVMKFVSPPYTAVMLCVPTLRADVAHVATPAASACAPQPVTELAPSLKFTLPVGVPAPGAVAVTVAVNVTLCPNTDGFTDDVRLVDVLAWLTTCVRVALVLVAKFVSALYTAVM